MLGAELRCSDCGRYKPDRCICHGEPRQANITQDDIKRLFGPPPTRVPKTMVITTPSGREVVGMTGAFPPQEPPTWRAIEIPAVEAEEDLYPSFPVSPIPNNNTCEEIPMQSGFNGTTASDLIRDDHVGEVRTKKVYPTPDPKYVIIENQLCNASTHEPIPMEEPIFVLRAKDACAIYGIAAYAQSVMDRNGSIEHVRVVTDRVSDFQQFAHAFPHRMKMPDTKVG